MAKLISPETVKMVQCSQNHVTQMCHHHLTWWGHREPGTHGMSPHAGKRQAGQGPWTEETCGLVGKQSHWNIIKPRNENRKAARSTQQGQVMLMSLSSLLRRDEGTTSPLQYSTPKLIRPVEREKNTRQTQIEGHSTNYPTKHSSKLSRSWKIRKDRNCHRPRRPRRQDNRTQCDILDWSLEQRSSVEKLVKSE